MNDEAQAVEERTMVAFRLADREFAAEVGQVREIVRLGAITRMPRAQPFMVGMMNLRGRVVPLLDLRRYLDVPPAPAGPNTRVVMVARGGGGMLGLIVDSVVEVLSLPPDAIDLPPSTLDVTGPLLTGVGRVGTRILLVIDLLKLATGLEMEESA